MITKVRGSFTEFEGSVQGGDTISGRSFALTSA